MDMNKNMLGLYSALFTVDTLFSNWYSLGEDQKLNMLIGLRQSLSTHLSTEAEKLAQEFLNEPEEFLDEKQAEEFLDEMATKVVVTTTFEQDFTFG
jgi:hypothetical protein